MKQKHIDRYSPVLLKLLFLRAENYSGKRLPAKADLKIKNQMPALFMDEPYSTSLCLQASLTIMPAERCAERVIAC